MKYVCLFIFIHISSLHSELSCILAAFTVCMNKQLEALVGIQSLSAFVCQIIFSSVPEQEIITILPYKHSQAQVITLLFQDELFKKKNLTAFENINYFFVATGT